MRTTRIPAVLKLDSLDIRGYGWGWGLGLGREGWGWGMGWGCRQQANSRSTGAVRRSSEGKSGLHSTEVSHDVSPLTLGDLFRNNIHMISYDTNLFKSKGLIRIGHIQKFLEVSPNLQKGTSEFGAKIS